MPSKKSKSTEIPKDGLIRFIVLDEENVCMVDAIRYDELMKYDWYPMKGHRSIYARSDLKTEKGIKRVYMHRLIANTPDGQITHHCNRNTLDNRESNLLNMTQKEHELLHKNNKLLIKFDENWKKKHGFVKMDAT